MPPSMPNPVPNRPDYDFIINPARPSRKLSLSRFKSRSARVAIVGAGTLLLLLLFVVIKSFFGGSVNNTGSLTAVVQYQRALIHISTAAVQQPGISATTQNSAATILASISSAQQQLLAYFKTNGQSVSKTVANKKISASSDAQLTAAAGAGNYDKTYQSIIQILLTDYEQALKQAYAQTKGPQGQALLASDYSSALLLAQQLVP